MDKGKNTIVLDVDRIAEKTLEFFAEMGLGIKDGNGEAEKRLKESLVNDFMGTESRILENNLAMTYVEQYIEEELQ